MTSYMTFQGSVTFDSNGSRDDSVVLLQQFHITGECMSCLEVI